MKDWPHPLDPPLTPRGEWLIRLQAGVISVAMVFSLAHWFV